MGINSVSAAYCAGYASYQCGGTAGNTAPSKTVARDTVCFSSGYEDVTKKTEEVLGSIDQTVREEVKKAEEAAKAYEQSVSEGKSEKKAQKTIAEMISEQMEKIDKMFSTPDCNKNKLSAIKQKIRGGLSLSVSEQQYLSIHDPDSYKQYQTIVSARTSFRASLNACRTKDDVTGMRMSNALSAMAALKKAARNGGDGEAIMGLNMALENDMKEFSRSARYRNLPTAAERDKYYADLSRARKYEQAKRAAERKRAQSKDKKPINIPGLGKLTVAQVMNSPVGRKVRAAEKSGGVSFSSISLTAYGKMNQVG